MKLIGLKQLPVLGLLTISQAFNLHFEAEKDIRFWLIGQDNEFDEDFTIDDASAVMKSSYDQTKPAVFQIHGFREGPENEKQIKLSKSLVEMEDQNVFFVDWSKGANTFDYLTARKRVNDVARIIGNFIELLHEHVKLSYHNVTMVGFSLGAHIAGLAGKQFLNGEVKRIVGIDPAGPKFSVNDPDNRLSPESAQYTECLHTGYPLGIHDPICHIDFYFNSGSKQPDCVNVLGLDSYRCSHRKAMEYFTESLTNPNAFYGLRCSSFVKPLDRNCNNEPGAFVNNPQNELEKLSGVFHVDLYKHKQNDDDDEEWKRK